MREAAYRRLLQLKHKSIEALRAATRSGSRERKRRAERLLKVLPTSQDVTSNIRPAGPYLSALQSVPLILLLLGASPGPAHAEAPGTMDEQVSRLIGQLDADTFGEREIAMWRLIEIGEPALSQVRKAAKGPSAEVKQRCRAILRRVYQDLGLPKLCGTWQSEKGFTFTVEGARWRWDTREANGGTGGTLAIVEIERDLMQVNMFVERGWSRGRTVKAIFRRDGGTLHYCGTYDKPRPRSFQGELDPYYVEWKSGDVRRTEREIP